MAEAFLNSYDPKMLSDDDFALASGRALQKT